MGRYVAQAGDCFKIAGVEVVPEIVEMWQAREHLVADLDAGDAESDLGHDRGQRQPDVAEAENADGSVGEVFGGSLHPVDFGFAFTRGDRSRRVGVLSAVDGVRSGSKHLDRPNQAVRGRGGAARRLRLKVEWRWPGGRRRGRDEVA